MFLPGLQKDVILAPYTTYKIGGPADLFVSVKSADELAHAVITAREAKIPYFVLGCGANILVRDKGFRGLVIHNAAHDVEWLPENQVRAASGAVIANLITACQKKGLSGLEHFVGIPSTVGGAVWQNLHFLSPDRTETFYIEKWIVSAEILTEKNERQTVEKDYFKFGYDTSVLHYKDVVVLSVLFQFNEASPEAIQQQMDANMEWRTAKQPQLWEYPSCGSVFQKIEDVGAGRLIDQAGLKGSQIGQAQISPKHANYIVNLGGAQAADVLALIQLAQAEVKAKFGYVLKPEIRIIGEE